MRRTWGVLLVLAVLVGCTPKTVIVEVTAPPPTPMPTYTAYPTYTPYPSPTVHAISADFRRQMVEFLTAGEQIVVATGQGVTYSRCKELVLEAKTQYKIIKSDWPASSDLVRPWRELDQAFLGWELALDLWAMKIGKKDEPTAPNTNQFAPMMDYGGAKLLVKKRKDDYFVKQYAGKEYLPFEENISILLGMAAGDYKEAQRAIQRDLK